MRLPIGRKSRSSKSRRKGGETSNGGPKSVATRKMIIAAARRIFAKHSYAAASFRMIGEEGGFSFTLINHYFSKAELFEAVAVQVVEELLAQSMGWLAGLEKMTPEKGLSLFLDRTLDYLTDNPDAVKILIQNVSQEAGIGALPGFDHFSSYVTDARKMITQVVPGGDDPDQSIMWVYGLINLLMSFIGASAYHGRVLGVDPHSLLYRKWIKDSIMYLFLPPLKEMARSRRTPSSAQQL